MSQHGGEGSDWYAGSADSEDGGENDRNGDGSDGRDISENEMDVGERKVTGKIVDDEVIGMMRGL